MPRENDLEGAQDQGGKHGGQAGMPRPTEAPTEEQRKAQRERKELDDSSRRSFGASQSG
jgi:hypothetical protein